MEPKELTEVSSPSSYVTQNEVNPSPINVGENRILRLQNITQRMVSNTFSAFEIMLEPQIDPLITEQFVNRIARIRKLTRRMLSLFQDRLREEINIELLNEKKPAEKSIFPVPQNVLEKMKEVQSLLMKDLLEITSIAIKPTIDSTDHINFCANLKTIPQHFETLSKLFINRIEQEVIIPHSNKEKNETTPAKKSVILTNKDQEVCSHDIFAHVLISPEICQTVQKDFPIRQSHLPFMIEQERVAFAAHYDSYNNAFIIENKLSSPTVIELSLINNTYLTSDQKMRIYYLFLAFFASQIQSQLFSKEEAIPYLLLNEYYCSWYSEKDQTIYIQLGKEFENNTDNKRFGLKMKNQEGVLQVGILGNLGHVELLHNLSLFHALYQQLSC